MSFRKSNNLRYLCRNAIFFFWKWKTLCRDKWNDLSIKLKWKISENRIFFFLIEKYVFSSFKRSWHIHTAIKSLNWIWKKKKKQKLHYMFIEIWSSFLSQYSNHRNTLHDLLSMMLDVKLMKLLAICCYFIFTNKKKERKKETGNRDFVSSFSLDALSVVVEI